MRRHIIQRQVSCPIPAREGGGTGLRWEIAAEVPLCEKCQLEITSGHSTYQQLMSRCAPPPAQAVINAFAHEPKRVPMQF
jgi:hypothetical protein